MGCSQSQYTEPSDNDECNEIKIKRPLLSDNDDENKDEIDNVHSHTKRLSNSSSQITIESSSPVMALKKKVRASSLPINPLQNVLDTPLEEQINSKLERSIVDLPVASDLPRMITRTIVFDKDESKLFDPSLNESVNAIENIKKLFLTLSTNLGIDAVTENVEKQYDSILPVDFEGDTTLALKSIVKDLVGEDNPVSNILKSLNQAIIAPAMMRLKVKLMEKLNYKDARNKWKVEIHLSENGILIIHKKVEQSIPEEFEFEWNLSIKFDSLTKNVVHADFKIVNIIFNEPDSTSQERSGQIEEKLKEFI